MNDINYRSYLIFSAKNFLLYPILVYTLLWSIGFIAYSISLRFDPYDGFGGYALTFYFGQILIVFSGLLLILLDLINFFRFFRLVKKNNPQYFTDTLFYGVSFIIISVILVIFTAFTTAPLWQILLPVILTGSLKLAVIRNKK